MAIHSDFYGWIKPHVNGAIDMIIDRAITDSMRMFCAETHAYKADLVVNPMSGTREYVLPAPASSEIIRVRTVNQNGTVVSPTTDDTLAISSPAYINQTSANAMFYTVPSTGSLRLHPTPSGGQLSPVTVAVAMRPTLLATTLPQFLLNEWAEAIADGALSRLKAQIDSAWGNAGQAQYHELKFREVINACRVRLNIGDASYNSSIQVRPFL